MATSQHDMPVPIGLTQAEVAQRRGRGQTNAFKPPTSRSYTSILRHNLLNPINIVLYVIGLALIALGRADEALLTVGVVMLNVLIGLVQEIRAKRTLDKIALLTRPTVTVIRAGTEQTIDPAELVVDDVMVVAAGDQIVVDSVVIGETSIEVDESQLTGESDLIRKLTGDEVFSGSFCVSGKTTIKARRVGADSFINKLAADAREFRVEYTPLQRDVNLIIRLLALLATIIGGILFVSALIHQLPLVRGVQIAAVIAGLIPSGMFAMVIVAYALGALRMAGRGALIQQTNAIESLSNVDVLCSDKTGTLTTNRIRLEAVHPLGGASAAIEPIIGTFARSTAASNKTGDALIDDLPGERIAPVDEVPFSSARKWSALAFDDASGLRGAYVLGAPEVLAPHLTNPDGVGEQVAALAGTGRRVLLFAQAAACRSLHDEAGDPALPPDLQAVAVISFTDELRPGVQETIAAFREAGVMLKIISGDNPETVTALAKQAGMAGDLQAVSGAQLAEMNDDQLETVAATATVFGRVTPQQKVQLVEALRRLGHYVAMTGDGVNDTLSLKKANLGIAMQSGTAATRSVADIILMNDSLDVLPVAFTEGQRIANGLRDTFKFFQTRSFFILLMMVAVSMVGTGFPFIPKHVALTALLSTTIPAFAMTLLARGGAQSERVLWNVYKFVATASLTLAAFGFLLYVGMFVLVLQGVLELPFSPELVADYRTYVGIDYAIETQDTFAVEIANLVAQTTLTAFSVITGAVLVLFVAPPSAPFTGAVPLMGDRRVWLVLAVNAVFYVIAFSIEPILRFFELVPLPLSVHGGLLIAAAAWAVLTRALFRSNGLLRFMGNKPTAPTV